MQSKGSIAHHTYSEDECQPRRAADKIYESFSLPARVLLLETAKVSEPFYLSIDLAINNVG